MSPGHLGAIEPLVLDGQSLTLADLARAARDPRVPVSIAAEGWRRIERAHALVEAVIERYRAEVARFRAEGNGEKPVQDYGLTTGFGEFKDIPIDPEDLDRLQTNLLLSHAVGMGTGCDPDDRSSYFPPEVVRAVLIQRLNTFAKGHSGIRPAMVEAVLALVARGIVPRVPLHGSVGSSGDLCPLAHLFVVLVGAGRFEVVAERADLAPGRNLPVHEGAGLAHHLGLEPPRPQGKDALALINGATFSSAALALAAADARDLAATADVAAALSLEALCGCARALDPRLHAARGFAGQAASAARMRELLTGSRLLDSAGAVQDAYSLRCAPVVHGASRDAISYVCDQVEREINAATDNPLLFPGEDGRLHDGEPWDLGFAANWPTRYRGYERACFSAGNFHGQPIALAADFLAIALAELASVSERRTQLLLDRHHNRGLPANLVADRGVQSGLMIVQYGAAGLVSENKVLAHPASVDSIPTAANVEDHNSMATVAARKARTVLANAQAVLAIELFAAAQGIDWRSGMGRRPCEPPPALSGDEEKERFRAAVALERRPAIAAQLGAGTRQAYLAVREAAPAVVDDRPLADDLLAVRRLVVGGVLARI